MFFRNIVSVLGHEGVVEGGTGTLTLTQSLESVSVKTNEESSEI